MGVLVLTLILLPDPGSHQAVASVTPYEQLQEHLGDDPAVTALVAGAEDRARGVSQPLRPGESVELRPWGTLAFVGVGSTPQEAQDRARSLAEAYGEMEVDQARTLVQVRLAEALAGQVSQLLRLDDDAETRRLRADLLALEAEVEQLAAELRDRPDMPEDQRAEIEERLGEVESLLAQARAELPRPEEPGGGQAPAEAEVEAERLEALLEELEAPRPELSRVPRPNEGWRVGVAVLAGLVAGLAAWWLSGRFLDWRRRRTAVQLRFDLGRPTWDPAGGRPGISEPSGVGRRSASPRPRHRAQRPPR